MHKSIANMILAKAHPFDVVEQLRTPDEMTAYLDTWHEEALDDAASIARALGDIARIKGIKHAKVVEIAQIPGVVA